MDVFTPQQSTALPREPFERAIREVNSWRGRGLNSFTRGEAAVTECLLALSTAPGRDGLVALPHLLGRRFDALTAAIGVNGPFAPEGRHATNSLARFRSCTELRNMLCHGVTDITLDQKGRWTAVIRLAALRSGRVAREVLVIREEEAEQLASEVTKNSNSLCSCLANLTRGLLTNAVPIRSGSAEAS